MVRRVMVGWILLVGCALRAQGPLLDLNTATAAQLAALPGMGPVYVRRIIAGRPYSAKNQLVRRGVLPKTAYEGIQDRVVAHRARAVSGAVVGPGGH